MNQSTDRLLRVGFIGCGSHAARNIFPTFAFTPVELVAVCDLDEARAKKIGARFGARHVYSDMEKMLERDDLEAVFIVVGYDESARPMYPKLAAKVLERNLHVWMEKPPAARVEDLRGVLDASKRSGKNVMVGLKKMFMPANRKAKELISRDGFEPSLLLAQYPTSAPTPDQFANYFAGKTEWKVQGFLDHLCHPVSMILGMFGPPTSVWFTNSNSGAGVATFTYDDGRVANLALTSGSSNDGGLERTTIIGRKGQHVIVENNLRVIYRRNAAPLPYGQSPDYFLGDPDKATAIWEPEFSLGQLYNKGLMLLGYFDEVNEFVNCALNGTSITRGTLQHAMQATAIFEAFAHGPGKLIQIKYDPAFEAA